MESMRDPTDSPQPQVERKQTFDRYVQQLPEHKQSTHRILVWFVAAAIMITLVIFVYALYRSFTWESAGGLNVVLAWMYFFLAGSVAAFLLGLDTLVVGATIPLPFGASEFSYEIGTKATKDGWGLIAYGTVVTVLVIVGVAALRAGILGIEDWLKLIVGLFVTLGVASGVGAIIRKMMRSDAN